MESGLEGGTGGHNGRVEDKDGNGKQAEENLTERGRQGRQASGAVLDVGRAAGRPPPSGGMPRNTGWAARWARRPAVRAPRSPRRSAHADAQTRRWRAAPGLPSRRAAACRAARVRRLAAAVRAARWTWRSRERHWLAWPPVAWQCVYWGGGRRGQGSGARQKAWAGQKEWAGQRGESQCLAYSSAPCSRAGKVERRGISEA
eukprot:363161-Chlamydomonas_euryale.AAC.2